MYLEYKDFVVRSATNDDVSFLLKWWNDGLIMAHAGFPNGLNINEDRIIKQIHENNDSKQRLIIECKNIRIGEMCYSQIDQNTVDIGIKICEFEYQNKGLGRKCLSMLIQELFKKYQKIVLDTDLENKRAQHVYESLGFERVRINYDSWENQIGELRNSVDYELTKKHFINYLD